MSNPTNDRIGLIREKAQQAHAAAEARQVQAHTKFQEFQSIEASASRAWVEDVKTIIAILQDVQAKMPGRDLIMTFSDYGDPHETVAEGRIIAKGEIVLKGRIIGRRAKLFFDRILERLTGARETVRIVVLSDGEVTFYYSTYIGDTPILRTKAVSVGCGSATYEKLILDCVEEIVSHPPEH